MKTVRAPLLRPPSRPALRAPRACSGRARGPSSTSSSTLDSVHFGSPASGEGGQRRGEARRWRAAITVNPRRPLVVDGWTPCAQLCRQRWVMTRAPPRGRSSSSCSPSGRTENITARIQRASRTPSAWGQFGTPLACLVVFLCRSCLAWRRQAPSTLCVQPSAFNPQVEGEERASGVGGHSSASLQIGGRRRRAIGSQNCSSRG